MIVGGTGVFGSRLARLLTRDGHDVTITGRNGDGSRQLAQELGCAALAYRLGEETGRLFDNGADVLVDAAGPFHAYEGDPYHLARSCLEYGANYLDLSDDADFTAGIRTLDTEFRAAGLFALSGASSVPGLSSAAARALSDDMNRIDVIESVILPGNKAPRGRSVVRSILAQVGATVGVWRGGRWRKANSWSDPETYEISPGDRRTARLVRVPDLELFPGFFRARSVLFRAGMETPLLNSGTRLLAWVRRAGLGKLPSLLVPLAQRLAGWMERFGSDKGGMLVMVTGTIGGRMVRRTWKLTVEEGDGPYIPCIAVRAILGRADRMRSGAGACLAMFALPDAEAAMADLSVKFERIEEDRPTLFRAALGDAWEALPQVVQRIHSVQDIESFSGTAEVIRGRGLLARLSAVIFRFPKAGRSVPLTITKTRTSYGEIWERNFAGRRFRSYLTPGRPGHYRERFGPFDYEQELPVVDGIISLPVRRGWFLGVPLPRPLLPGSDSREFAEGGIFRFDVGLFAPLTGELIVRYRGTVTPDEDLEAVSPAP
ncbi:MAG: DUF4166 domain-containing protein [Minwuia sp.]|uniref:DUF4166 domain-containing protein n=1 Tax=Minwuia sp. TaxID=2493630 RepID=UPI003A8A0B86